MPKYEKRYGFYFQNTIETYLPSEKEKRALGKSVPVILGNPKKDATTVKNSSNPVLWRKHVCAETMRLIYMIEEEPVKIVRFFAVLPKSDKRLYKKLYKYIDW